MILDHEVVVPGRAAEVFALINDVERVVRCLPGAALEGRDGESYLGTVKVKVGPISASYYGKVRFTEVDAASNTLHLVARGDDSHGSGDAEAEVRLSVTDTAAGAQVNIRTDLLIRGKIAQFGKGAIPAVSAKILQAFAANLAALLEADRTGPLPVAVPARPVAGPVAGPPELDGIGLLLSPALRKWGPICAAFLAGTLEGWLLNRAFGRGR